MPGNPNKSLPSLLNMSDAIQVFKKWQTQLNPLLIVPKTPHSPYNFSATSARGGVQLSWAPIANTDADGYQILRSSNGDFSNPTTIPIPNVRQSSYFDSLGGQAGGTAGITMWYRIRATNGTPARPQSVLGVVSGTVKQTSLDPTNTTSPSTTIYDVSTNDQLNATAGRGRIIPHTYNED